MRVPGRKAEPIKESVLSAAYTVSTAACNIKVMRESLPHGRIAAPTRSKPDHANDLIEEPEQEPDHGERDHDGNHSNDKVQEQREDINHTLDDGREVCGKVKRRVFHLLVQSFTSGCSPL